MHKGLGFDVSNKHSSLNDKQREVKREQLKNLRMLIVDEFSMLKVDLLYRIDLRLREITQVNKDFGGISVFLFGDPLQLRPVKGRYIFEAPSCPDYLLAYGDGSDTLWRSFDVINLEENHRQGEDKSYAEMLNRIRFGRQSDDDLKVLESRVRSEGHPDLEGAMLISPRKVKVARFNEKCINELTGKLYKSKAVHIQAMSKNFKPAINDSGCIGPTQFVDTIHLKIGARVMLIYNVDVSDLLCNGSTGRVIGIEENQKGIVIAVVVKFDNPKAGKESRNQNPAMALKYPDGTVIKKIEYEYRLAK